MMLGLGDSLVDGIAQAIAQMEGFNTPGTIAQRDNNPGNLRSGPGQTGTDSKGYAIFPDVSTGFAALNNQIQLNIDRGLTLYEFFGGKPGVYAGYAPSADSNNPIGYANFVAQQVGIDPSIPLNQIQAGSMPSIDPTGGISTDGTTVDSTGILGMDSSTTMIAVGIGVAAIGLIFFMSGGAR